VRGWPAAGDLPGGAHHADRRADEDYDGPGLIADKAEAAIIPVRLDGLQFPQDLADAGQAEAALVSGIAPAVLPPVDVVVPEELKGRARRAAAGAHHAGYHGGCRFRPERLTRSLFGAFAGRARLYDKGLPVLADIVPDDTGSAILTEIGYRRLILGSVVLGRELGGVHAAGEHVGVMLPNAVGSVVTFFALQSQGRVPAMMNFTAGPEGMLSCCLAAVSERF